MYPAGTRLKLSQCSLFFTFSTVPGIDRLVCYTHISMPASAFRLSTTVNVNNRTHDHFVRRRDITCRSGADRKSSGGGARPERASAPGAHRRHRTVCGVCLLNERIRCAGRMCRRRHARRCHCRPPLRRGGPGKPPRAPRASPPRACRPPPTPGRHVPANGGRRLERVQRRKG